MAVKPLQLHQIRKIIELVVEIYSTRKIATLTGTGRRKISDYRPLLLKIDIPLAELLKCDDEALSATVYHTSEPPVLDERLQYSKCQISPVELS